MICKAGLICPGKFLNADTATPVLSARLFVFCLSMLPASTPPTFPKYLNLKYTRTGGSISSTGGSILADQTASIDPVLLNTTVLADQSADSSPQAATASSLIYLPPPKTFPLSKVRLPATTTPFVIDKLSAGSQSGTQRSWGIASGGKFRPKPRERIGLSINVLWFEHSFVSLSYASYVDRALNSEINCRKGSCWSKWNRNLKRYAWGIKVNSSI